MKRAILAGFLVASGASIAAADVYADNVGNHLAGGDLHDFFQSQGFDHLDIVQVEVTNDATNLYFDIQLNADIDATNWGNYIVALDNGSGVASDNPWGPRPMDWNGQAISHWIGSWANDGGSAIGGQLWEHDGFGWNQTGGLSSADDSQHASGHQIFSITLAELGVGVGDTILFDVMTSGGGGTDPGVDHLSRSDFTTDDWGVGSTAGAFLSYTIVPAPSGVALLALGGLAATRRRRS
jgi:hypothetical protein